MSTSENDSRLSEQTRNKVALALQHAESCDITESALPWRDWSRDDFEARFAAPIPIARPFLADGRLGTWGDLKGQITRRDLFILASDLGESPSTEEATAFAVNVNAWGFGTTGYGHSRTERIFDHGDPEAGSRAAEAIRILRSDGPVEAYFYLYNRGGNDSGETGNVLNWGPAFFTKFLYFADLGNQPTASPTLATALVLDQFLAQAINAIVPTNPVGVFAKNGWTTPQYAFYINLMRRLARSASTPSMHISAGMAEAALFGEYAGRPASSND